MISYIRIIAVFIFFVMISIPLQAGVIILINGKLIDKANGKPISTKVRFIDSTGKEHSSNSNSIDGIFQQVLPSGNSYTMIVDGWVLDYNQRNIVVNDYTEYTEFGYEYQVTKLAAGLVLASGHIFKKNSSELIPESDVLFNYIKELNKTQKGLVFSADISSSDSYFKPRSKTVKIVEGGKSKSRKIQQSTEAILKDLLDDRKSVLLEKMKELGINPKNVNVKTDLIVKKPMPNIKVKTGKKLVKIDDVFSKNLDIKIERIMKL